VKNHQIPPTILVLVACKNGALGDAYLLLHTY
jgi:hypothetical protein